MNHLTTVFKALSDRNRLRIVSALMQHKELCACQLTELLHVTGATASRHMGVLISADLVDSRKEGRWVYYRSKQGSSDLNDLFGWIERQLENDSTVESDSKSLAEITSCEPEDLCRKQREEACWPNK